MKKVITYGTYDLLHYGHIKLLERAKRLGDYLIVGVTSDAFDKNRGKLNVQQSVLERVEAIRSTGLSDEIIIEEYEGQKIADIKKYDIDIFAIGSDWLGKFDYLKDYCEVVYLKRTDGISSTEIRINKNPIIKIGMIGLGNPAERVIKECRYVSGMSVWGAWDKNNPEFENICGRNDIHVFCDLDNMLKEVDAVYIARPISEHAKLISQVLNAGCHVLCESPIFASVEMATEAFTLAQRKKLVLFEAIKTLFFPAFERLMLIVRSGTIGSVRDIDVSCSYIPDGIELMKKDKYQGCMYDWGSIMLLPIIKILGIDYEDCILYDYENNEYNYFIRGVLKYKKATAVFKAGKGIKTEGEMIITGTKGYIYIPAPWWKTDYFEIRYEDLRETKKYFYKFDGEGFRYELVAFAKMINQGILENNLYSKDEMISVIKIIEQFDKKEVQKM